jgi:PAS domain S-box-containing protein
MVLARSFRPRLSAAWLVLVGGLLLVLLANHVLFLNLRQSRQDEFVLHVQDVVDAIRARMRRHEQILLGAAGLYDASGTVERDEWRAYIARLRLEVNFPGIQGVGYSQVLRPAELAAHVRAVRAEGFPDYRVHPAGRRDLYTAIVYLEPFRDRNLAAFGYDMYSEPVRREAMRRAGESGATRISAKVKLLQETHGKAQAGFLMYVPVYRAQRSLETADQRWAALRGFVFSPYRMDDLMRGLRPAGPRPLAFRIHDGFTQGEEVLMFDSDEEAREAGDAVRSGRGAQFQAVRVVEAYGHGWTVTFQSLPPLEVGWISRESVLLLAGGGVVSLMLFVLVGFLSSRREQAEALAHEMTAGIRAREEALRQSEARLNEAQRTAKIGSWEYDPASDRLVWSAEVYRLFELDPQQFPANYEAVLAVVHPDDREDVDRAYQDALADRRPHYDITYRLRMPDGRIKWVHANCHTDFDAAGRPLRSRGTLQDVTLLAEAERQARESAEFAESILENAADGIITINDRGEVHSFNRAAERIFDYDAQEVIGRNVSMLMPEPHRSAHDGYLARFRDAGQSRVMGRSRELEGQRRDGSVFAMDLVVSQIYRHDEPLFIGLVRDITERKRVEQLKSEFVSTVSHELRTPLTSISGALGLVCGGALGEVPPQARTMLDIAHKNSQRLTHLINDLLDMEKLAAGKMRFDLKTLELMPLVEQALESNKGYGERYRVTLVLGERAEGAKVRVDAGRLQQVLSNLLSNAIKFSPAGAPVQVHARVGADVQAGWVRVEVVDQGPGVPPEFRERIFQKFSQADGSDARQRGGTGLGLAISKELTERMHGRVGFDSQPGAGACFYLELPLATVPATPAPAGHRME